MQILAPLESGAGPWNAHSYKHAVHTPHKVDLWGLGEGFATTTFATESKPSLEYGSSFSAEEPARLPVNPVFSESSKALAYKHRRGEEKEKSFSAQEKTLPPGGEGGPRDQRGRWCLSAIMGYSPKLPNLLLDANCSSAPSCSHSSWG